MSYRGKRKTRVLQVALAVLAGGGLAVGGYVLRQEQLDSDALAARESGRAALAAGDYPAALDGLGRYIQRAGNRGATSEDYVLYARARRHVELPNGKHMVQAIASLRRALEKDPSNAEARQELLDGYLETGYATEALALIEDLLAGNPDDLKLLGVKADVLEAQRQFDKALVVARKIASVSPDDLVAAFRVLRLLVRSQALPSEVDKWVGETISAHAADSRWELLRAATFTSRGDADRANRSLDGVLASPRTAWDPPFIALLVSELDAAGRPADALHVLEALPETADAELQRELLRRLWYAKRLDDVVTRVGAAKSGALRDDPELVALHAAALIALGRPEQAGPMRTDLAGRGDAVGKAWCAYVDSALAVTPDKVAESVPKLTAAVAAVPGSAFLRQALGDAHSAVGEADLAIQDWDEASLRAPSWSRPLVAKASVLMRTPGREFLAPGVASAALKRCPEDLDAIRVWVESMVAVPGELPPEMQSKLLEIVAKVESRAPAAGSDLLPIELGIVAATDKAAAQARMQAVLEARAPASESTLLRLAQIAEQAGIPLGSRFLDVSERVHGVTPELALAKALLAAKESGAPAGLRVLDEMTAGAGPAAKGLDWALVRASYLDSTGDPGAGRAWFDLADAHPEELQAQLGVLASASAWSSPDAMERVITRVERLSHGRGVTWRLARARLILNTPDVGGSKIAEAASLLSDTTKLAPQSTAARLLLAQAFEKLGNLAGAEEQLRIAADLTPGDAWIALEIGRLAQLQGHPDAARRQIDRALALGNIAPEQIERAAYLLAVQGDRRRGTGLLEPLMLRPGASREATLLLAHLYAELGETNRAIEVCERLLPRADAEVIELAADLYATAGRTEDAAAVLARLDAASLHPGDGELVRARHAARWGDRDSARSLYRSAVDAAPARQDAWTSLATFAIAAGDADLLASATRDPRAAAVEPLQFLASIGPLAASCLSDDRLKGALIAAMNDKPDRPVLVDAIRLATQGAADPARRVSAARAIRDLADSNAKVLPLQVLAAALLADAGDPRSGCEVALRCASAFPNSVAAAQLSAELLARTGRWEEALESGLAWRARASSRDADAEVFVAQARLRTGRLAEAVAGLEPGMSGALARPDANVNRILLYAVGLARTGRSEKSIELLRDLADRSPRWRTLAVGFDPVWFGDAATASAWLRSCAEFIPSQDVEARVALGRAWGSAWERFRTPELLAEARKVLDPLCSAPDAPLDALVAEATLDQAVGELESARKRYMTVLARDAARLDARNNLAMVLADLGQWESAVDEAARVTGAAPGSAEAYETLAYAQRKGRQFTKAEASLTEAVRLEPFNPRWAVTLAETLAESGDAEGLTRQLARIETAFPGASDIPPPLRDRLDRLRAPKK
jgi:Tfp pilus assembly protein PilF